MSLWQAISVAGLPTVCFPAQAATDKLASLRAKALKYAACDCILHCPMSIIRFDRNKVIKPFPLVDIALFLPPWAAEACFCSLCVCDGCTFSIIIVQANDLAVVNTEDQEVESGVSFSGRCVCLTLCFI